MTDEKRERFGKYLILDHLVDGGMAKICRAKFLGEQASKVVAIKMVQPQFSKDESFKTMFMDEVKLTFALLHPNIIQTYDYGMHNDQLFVAMEYCDGRNLKE
ncbi:MAG: protein kinase, partial [Bacteriovoracaceae bacterium]|nr:protein kinase [Bacteriovoracaceae bacterium]